MYECFIKYSSLINEWDIFQDVEIVIRERGMPLRGWIAEEWLCFRGRSNENKLRMSHCIHVYGLLLFIH